MNTEDNKTSSNEGVMSVSNLSEVKQMYEAQNMMKGVRP
jgi:hypothetical protein